MCALCGHSEVVVEENGVTYIASVLLDIFVIFLVAKLAGELFDRFDQPPVIGELLAGMLIGPHVLGILGAPDPLLVQLFGDEHAASEALKTIYEVLAQVGVIVLLFYVGLETHVEVSADVAGEADKRLFETFRF